MDYQWQRAGDSQTTKLHDELDQIKKRFHAQSQMSLENRELKE